MKKIFFSIAAMLCVFCLATGGLFASDRLFERTQKLNMTAEESAAFGMAEEEFKRGVQAYYKGAYNDAILQFEQALSYVPNENLILDWLGRAYYHSGIEGAALQQWQFALDSGYGGLLLQNRMESVRLRRMQGATEEKIKYTQSGSFEGISGTGEKDFSFLQPISVLPLEDGSVWVTAYGSNEILCFDVNGYITRRVRGPLNGFDRPLDIIKLQDDNLLVTEAQGDRLSILSSDGKFIKHIGQKGNNIGEFFGPQFATQDTQGNIFVTDFGNLRVVVFDKEGKPLFTFGGKTDDFEGLKGPTGIAYLEGSIFVCDCVKGKIEEFDVFGNYRGELTKDKSFLRPESLKVFGKNLITADTNHIYSIDSTTGAISLVASLGQAPTRLTSATCDANGSFVTTDFFNDSVAVMSQMSDVIGGLFVQIEKVDASAFPNVAVELKVENRKRQPIVGLKSVNFFLSENKSPVLEQKLIGSGFNEKDCDIAILIDRNIDTKQYATRLETAVCQIAKSMAGKGNISIVSAGKIPLIEYSGSPQKIENFNSTSLKTPYTDSVALDLGIRLAGGGLINGKKKRGLIFITDGAVGYDAFSQYGLSDLSAFLNNNSISFSVIDLGQDTPLSQEINFLTQSTPGTSYYVYRSEGLGQVVSDIKKLPNGIYQLTYTSSLPREYGKSYLPLEAEVYLQTRSGADTVGYFAPAQ